MSNSKELFILLTAAMIYLDTIYIFPDYVDVGEVISICKHRGLGMLYTAKQKTYKIDSYEMDVNDNNVKVVLLFILFHNRIFGWNLKWSFFLYI